MVRFVDGLASGRLAQIASLLSPLPVPPPRRTDRPYPIVSGQALLLSQVLAIVFWLVALYVRGLNIIPIWYDQRANFVNVAGSFFDPYQLPGFVSPAWVTVFLVPFGVVGLPIAALLQTCLLFGLVTALIYKHGGNFRTALIVLASFVALDNALEINIDWIVALGLLLPSDWSLPLLLVKPQDALGVLLSYSRRHLIRAVAVMASVFACSLVIWGNWPLRMLAAIQRYTLLDRNYNIAPLAVLPVPLALLIGIGLAYVAFRRRDPALSILAGLFFTPYIAFYSLLIPFAMLATRWPRLALIITVCTWLIYGGVLWFARISQ